MSRPPHYEVIVYDREPPRLAWFHGDNADKDLAKFIGDLHPTTTYKVYHRVDTEWQEQSQ